MRVWHPESIPTSMSLMSSGRLIWELSPLYISWWISGRSWWNQEAFANPELIQKSASLWWWICGLSPSGFHPIWLKIRPSRRPGLWIRTFRLCTIVRIPEGIATLVRHGLRARAHWPSTSLSREGNSQRSSQYQAVNIHQCEPETSRVYCSTQKASICIWTDDSWFGILSWTCRLLSFESGVRRYRGAVYRRSVLCALGWWVFRFAEEGLYSIPYIGWVLDSHHTSVVHHLDPWQTRLTQLPRVLTGPYRSVPDCFRCGT